MSQPLHNERIFGLDLMRAMAILMVVSAHVLWIYGDDVFVGQAIFNFFGYLGVELFFVLSGFLIGIQLYKQYILESFSHKTVFVFLKRRWFRTLPNYYLYLGVNIIIATFVIGYEIPDLWKYFLFLQNLTSTMLPFFAESWSLSVEEAAYIILPFFLFLFYKLSGKISPKYKFLWVVMTLIFLFTLHRVGYHYTTQNTLISEWNLSLKDVVLYRVDAVMYGVLAAWIYINKPNFWKKYALWAAGIGWSVFLYLSLGIGLLRYTIDAYPAFWNIFYLPLTSLIGVCFLPVLSLWKFSNAFYAKSIEFISVISYSIYLIHYSFVLQLMKFYFPTEALSLVEKHLYAIVFIAITILFSWLNYRFFEKPIMDIRDKI